MSIEEQIEIAQELLSSRNPCEIEEGIGILAILTAGILKRMGAKRIDSEAEALIQECENNLAWMKDSLARFRSRSS